MKNRLLISLVTAASITGAVLVSPRRDIPPAVFYQHEIWPGESAETTGLDEDGVLSTHLPIITLHTNGIDIPGTDLADKRTLMCSYSIVWNEDGVNRSDDPPAQTGQLELSIRGNSSRRFAKKQYSLKLMDKQGNPRPEAMLGMPAETTWVLNGSLIDHSLIRNYMLYNLSGSIMNGYNPRCRLCEVMMTDENGDTIYQGVYTLIEKPKVARNRLDLQPYDPAYTETSFLLQMNSHTDNIRIDHLKPDHITVVYPLDVEYPGVEDITPESIQYIKSEVLQLEKLLMDGVHTQNWSRVNEALDLDSFVDYYLINQFFQNYDAGRRSTYLYKNLDGRYQIGPVWDFDGAFNNFTDINIPVSALDMDSTFYYSFLSGNPYFSQKCIQRYWELRKHILSDENLLEFIDRCADYLGSAAERNADVWYQGDYTLFTQDIQDMKTFVLERGAWMDQHFEDFSMPIEW